MALPFEKSGDLQHNLVGRIAITNRFKTVNRIAGEHQIHRRRI